jgi:hydrogenase-4 component B
MNAFGTWLELFVALCVVGLALAWFAPAKRSPPIVAWVGGLAALIVIGLGAGALFASAPFAATLWDIPSLGAIVLRADALSGLFLVVTGLVFFPVSIFAANALPRLPGRYNLRTYAVMYLALFVSVVWILVSGDVFSFLVAWEIMSILCYLLVSFEHEDGANPKAGYLMLAVSEAGALAAALGLLLLAASASSLDFAGLKTSGLTLGTGARWMIFLLTFFGFGVKAGLVPVNFWLPSAYTAAPAAFAPVLAGATLNLGLYGIFRVNADLLPAVSVGPGLVALVVGTISALVGILYATTDNDLKTLLAHSSIENAGIITVSFGAGLVFTASGKPSLASIAFLVAFYHLANHSLYKALLFVGTGVVDERAGTRDLDRMGGLIRRMPWTALAFLAGALAIAALPPFNGFVSEWLTLQTFLRSAELSSVGVKIVFALCGAALALTAALAVTCFVKMFAMGFLGMTRSPEAEQATEAKSSALIPMAFLAVLCLLLGVLPTYVIGVLDRVTKLLAGSSAATALVPPFFVGSPGHQELPGKFVDEFHELGAQVGQGIVPGSGLVILHRGGAENPVVFAGAPTYLIIVLAGLLVITFLAVHWALARRRTVTRRVCWDGGIRRLFPEMTYTATGFSNPVRVIFQAIFRPTIVEDTRETVAEHFRTAIRREREEIHIVDRFVLQPVRRAALGFANGLATMHRGQLNAYITYGLLGLLAVLLLLRLFQGII